MTSSIPFSRFNILSGSDLPFNYIYTPKNACSTIKATLIRRAVNPHDLVRDLYEGKRIDPDKPFFVITRNPISRFMSAYLDKIGPGKDPGPWRSICAKYALDQNECVPPEKLLELMLGDEPDDIEPHFRPQYLLHSYASIRPAFMGRFEDFPGIVSFITQMGFELVNYSPHSKSGASKAKSLSSTCISMLLDLYSKDFEYYGYEPNIESSETPCFVSQPQMVSREFRAFCNYENESVEELLRKSLVFEVDGDLESAILLLKVAKMKRPGGSVISARLSELEAKAD